MPKLKCNVNNCRHHHDIYCCKDRVKIDGVSAKCSDETCCSSFKEQEKAKDTDYLVEMAEFSVANEYVSITCESENCLHNKKKTCHANCVDIIGENVRNKHDTTCGSFVNRISKSKI